MITRVAVVPLLLEACPSFGRPWAAYAADTTFDESLLYVHLGRFAGHVVELMGSGSTEEFAAVFNVIERLHMEGDFDVREAATIGLLEGLQNQASSAGLDPGVFEPHLGPESARWWAELNQFWDGKLPYVGAGLRRER